MLLLQASKSLIGADYTAYILIFISNGMWMLGLLLGTQDPRINSIYIGLVRGFACFLISYILSWIYGTPLHFPYLPDLYKLTLRNSIMTVQGFLFAISFQYLQVPIVYTISNAGPIIVFILDYFMHQTEIHKREKIGIVISSVGIMLAINSHLIYRQLGIPEELHSEFKYIECSLEMKMLVAMLFLAITVGWAYAIVLTKTFKNINSVQVNFHLGIELMAVNAIAIMFVPNPVQLTIMESVQVFWRAGFPLAASSFIYISSLFICKKSGNLTIIGFTNVIVGYGISMVRYHQTPNLIGVIGSVCIGIGLILVLIK